MSKRSRERQRIRKPQCAVTCPKLRSSSSKRAIDLDYVHADRGEELVDRGVGAVLQRPDDHLGVHRCRDQNIITARKARSKDLNRWSVLRVRRIKERDDDVCIERYSPHSPRS